MELLTLTTSLLIIGYFAYLWVKYCDRMEDRIEKTIEAIAEAGYGTTREDVIALLKDRRPKANPADDIPF
jgi:hypothetical protein